MRIGIIGSGVSGLALVWLLGKNNHVSLFEKKGHFGLGNEGVTIDGPEGPFKIDVPPRVINQSHYQHLFRLLGDLELTTDVIQQQPSFSNFQGETYLAFHRTRLQRPNWIIPKFAPSTLRWLWKNGAEMIRWIRFVHQGDFKGITKYRNIEELLRFQGYGDDMIFGALFPMWALICTCNYEDLNRFPPEHLLAVFRNFTGSSHSRRIRGGSKAVEEKIKQRITTEFFHTSVKKIKRSPANAGLVVVTEEEEIEFDHVILATEPSYAADLLDDDWKREKSLLETVPWVETEMVLHSDERLMPQKRYLWSSVNLFWNRESNETDATVWMNPIERQTKISTPLFQSRDPKRWIDPSKILVRRTFRRSLSNSTSEQAMGEFRRLMLAENRRLWFTGSYLTPGVPLLENGVASAQFIKSSLERSSGP